MSNQKIKTKDYWDEFYSQLPSAGTQSYGSSVVENDETTSDLEWIVPHSAVLDTILSLLSPSSQSPRDASQSGEQKSASKTINLLEIGCGVSQLSISLLHRLILHDQDTTARVISCTYNIVATDVSLVCIDHNRERDSVYTSSLQNDGHRLSYEVLDVLSYDASSPHMRQYGMILDKGTLDTFLFRSKRTKKGISTHPPILTPLLNNIHRWLRSECEAKYIIISPRPKIMSVRDFRGFASVRRKKIDTAAMSSDVVLVKGNSDTSKQSKSVVYLYECIKNDYYHPDHDAPYRDIMECNANDESLCSTCGINFKEFLGKVDARDQGEIVWARRWKNHCVHCKA